MKLLAEQATCRRTRPLDSLVLRLACQCPLDRNDDPDTGQRQADQGHNQELADQVRLPTCGELPRVAEHLHGNPGNVTVGTVTGGVVPAGVFTGGTVTVGVVTDEVVTVGGEGSDGSGIGIVTPADAPAPVSTSR